MISPDSFLIFVPASNLGPTKEGEIRPQDARLSLELWCPQSLASNRAQPGLCVFMGSFPVVSISACPAHSLQQALNKQPLSTPGGLCLFHTSKPAVAVPLVPGGTGGYGMTHESTPGDCPASFPAPGPLLSLDCSCTISLLPSTRLSLSPLPPPASSQTPIQLLTAQLHPAYL